MKMSTADLALVKKKHITRRLEKLRLAKERTTLPYERPNKVLKINRNFKKSERKFEKENPIPPKKNSKKVKQRLLKAYYRSRYHSLRTTIQNRQKTSKPVENPCLPNSNRSISASQKREELPAVPKEQQKHASEQIKKRATEFLANLEQRRTEELKRLQEAKEKELNMRKKLRQAVLSSSKTVDNSTPSYSKQTSELPSKYIDTDMVLYRKKNRLDDSTKIFIVSGGFPDLINSLKLRGWHENTDKTSPCFDLIWTVSSKDIDFYRMQENQLCNHYTKSSAITTKIGLMTSLRNLIWFNNVDIDSFYPRAFNLNDPDEREDFILEFKAVYAENILKKALKGQALSERAVQSALAICERRRKDIDDIIDEEDLQVLVSDLEWKDMQQKATSIEISDEIKEQAKSVMAELSSKNPQTAIDGTENIWIVKPAGLSRGRGIAVYNDLKKIKEHTSKEGNWIVQKYIENPLVISGKKFDIRQWVLVTCWNPLTIWFYDRCYCRFGVEDFSLQNIEDIHAHLTNNSIVKNSENFQNSESMWHSEDLQSYLLKTNGSDLWEEQIKGKIQAIIKWSLQSAQDMVNNRKNSFELYGYDFMLDESFIPWLIEINKSPAMDYSTPVTEKLVKLVLEDCAKVIVDYHFTSEKRKHMVDTGHFKLIYKAKRTVQRPIQSMGLNLMCQGTAIKM